MVDNDEVTLRLPPGVPGLDEGNGEAEEPGPAGAGEIGERPGA